MPVGIPLAVVFFCFFSHARHFFSEENGGRQIEPLPLHVAAKLIVNLQLAGQIAVAMPAHEQQNVLAGSLDIPLVELSSDELPNFCGILRAVVFLGKNSSGRGAQKQEHEQYWCNGWLHLGEY